LRSWFTKTIIQSHIPIHMPILTKIVILIYIHILSTNKIPIIIHLNPFNITGKNSHKNITPKNYSNPEENNDFYTWKWRCPFVEYKCSLNRLNFQVMNGWIPFTLVVWVYAVQYWIFWKLCLRKKLL